MQNKTDNKTEIRTKQSSGNKSNSRKPKRKLKNGFIRKAIAGVLIASAVVVAAIPEDKSGLAAAANNEILSYTNDSTLARNSELPVTGLSAAEADKLKRPANENDIFYSYEIRKVNGLDTLVWKYQYFVPQGGINNVKVGVICGYNDNYKTDDLFIGGKLYTGYDLVKKSDYDSFWTQNGNNTIGYDNLNGYLPTTAQINEIDTLMARYFGNDATYNSWKTKYENKVAEYVANNGQEPVKFEDIQMANDIFAVKVSSMSSDNQKIYYCDNNGLRGYTLTIVENSAQGSQYIKSIDPNDITNRVVDVVPNENQIFVVTLNNLSECSSDNEYDERNFRYLASQNIGAIGEYAFAGSQKAMYMTIGNGISLIGDHAFENSFVRNVEMESVNYIGNYVFKNCEFLTELHLEENTDCIGKEAFYGCVQLKNVKIPAGCKNLGFGAFANCQALKFVDFTENLACNIGEYAFYNCLSLEKVTFPEVPFFGFGKAAFAVEAGTGSTSKLQEFVFPLNYKAYESATDSTFKGYEMTDCYGDFIATIGDYMFANRDTLSKVELPLNYGSSYDSTNLVHLPPNFFDECRGLGLLKLGSSQNKYIYFDESLFEDVENKSLYVFGPQSKINNNDGINNSDVADPRYSTWQTYSKVLDYVPYVYNDGVLDHYEVGSGDYRYELQINPDNTTATLISCDFINQPKPIDVLVVPSYVADYEINEMQTGCLNNVKDYIIKLSIPDGSIERVDDGVFRGASLLEEVEMGDSVKEIGIGAFADCPVLKVVTIGENIRNIEDSAFKDSSSLQDVYWTSPSDYSLLQNIGQSAFFTGSDKLYFHEDVQTGYLPFDYAMDNVNPGNPNYINSDGVRICCKTLAPAVYTMIKDDISGEVLLLDYPIYADLASEIRNDYEATGGANLTPEQRMELDATEYLTIPSVVESIDIKRYLVDSASNPNKQNWRYIDDSNQSNFYTTNSASKRAIYGNDNLPAASSEEIYSAGLFSGYFFDDTPISVEEGRTPDYARKGNDWIKAVTMYGVKEIPDYAFDSCERLEAVVIGDDCSKIGESAFLNCSNLMNVGTSNNPVYTCDRGILYEKKSDGKLILNTCLPARGSDGTKENMWVTTKNDPNLPLVDEVKEGAFSNCKYLTNVDLTDSGIQNIPTRCFEGCKELTDVKLPTTIQSIAKDSFKDAASRMDITIPSDAGISDSAFEPNAKVTIWTYETCTGVASFPDRVGNPNYIVEFLGSKYIVRFLNDDNTLFDEITVDAGGNGYYPELILGNPIPKLPVNQGGTFKYWYFSDGSSGIINVTENREAIAVFELPSPSPNNGASPLPSGASPLPSGASPLPSGASPLPSGASPVPSGSATPTASVSQSSVPGSSQAQYVVEVENGAGGGNYTPGSVVTITAYAAVSGKEFDKWTTSNSDIGFSDNGAVSTTFIMPTHDVKVTATYKTAGSSSSNNGNSGNNGNYGNNVSGNNANGNGGTHSGGNGTDVTITTGVIDNNNKNLASATVAGSTDNFIVKITDSAAAYAEVEQALKNAYGNDLSNIKFVAFDISLYDETGTQKIQNYDGLAVTITIPIPDELVPYAGNNQAGAIINGRIDDKTTRFTTIDGVPCMTFTATHFSPYTVYVNTAALTAGVTDSTPKTGDGIAPKWFLAVGLGCIGAVLFLWKDKKRVVVKKA